MLKNYLKIALRNIGRNKVYSLINVLGLTLGISVFTLLWLYVQHELSFNKFHSNSARIYRIYEEIGDPDGGKQFTGTTSMSLVNALKADFPEVEEKANVTFMGQSTITIGAEKYIERNYLLADPSFFDVFDTKIIGGQPKQLLGEFASAVVSSSTAEKFFGHTDVVGKILEVNRFGNVPITAVFEDFPSNSELSPNIIYACDFQTWNERWVAYFNSWEYFNGGGFILLHESSDPRSIMDQKEAFLKKYLADEWETRDFFLQPLSEMHLKSSNIIDDYAPFDQRKGNIEYIYIFSAIGLFVLLIACINYINLATARSFQRMKEVGIRKVIGASRKQLIGQFLSESTILALISVLISVGVVELILPTFNTLAGKDLNLNLLNDMKTQVFFIIIGVSIGILSGIAPAFVMSGFRITEIFKGTNKRKSQIFTRRGLVILQFAISIIMIVSTLVVYLQLNFVEQKPLGFDKEELVIVDINSSDVRSSFQAMKNEFLNNSEIYEVTATSRVPGEWKDIPMLDIVPPQGSNSAQGLSVHFMAFDEHALETFEIELLEGRNFTGNAASDSLAVLLNEAAVKLLGYDNAIGKTFRSTAWNERVEFSPRVVGVVKDFHFQSLYDKIRPLVIGFRHNPVHAIDYFSLKVSSGNLQETIAYIEEVHSRFDHHNPTEYNFLEAQLERFYKKDQRRGEIFAIAAFLAVIIACLGLFGLASYTAQQRTKEFGIRKVLGASVTHIVVLLSRQYAALVAIAFVISVPISWYMMSRWLSEFAYRISLGAWIFVISGLMALLVAIVTVSYRSVIAAKKNPVVSLRYE